MSSLVDYLDKGASLGRDAPCLVEGERTLTYGEVQDLSWSRRGRAGRVGRRAGRQGRDPLLQRRDRVRLRVRDRPPRRGLVPDQPAQRGRREPCAARAVRLRVPALSPELRRHGGRGSGIDDARSASTSWTRGSASAVDGRAGRAAGRPGDARRDGRHDRAAQGRDADRAQPRDDDRADADGLPVQRAARRISRSRR